MCYWKTDRTFHFSTCFIFVALATVLCCCNSKRQAAEFYPIDSLIMGQIQHLTAMKAGLFKEAFLNGETDTLTYVPEDTVAWVDELGIFRKLQIINKPVNKDSYRVNDGLFDPESNLTVKAFTSIKKLPVVYLKVFYQGSLDKPRKIEALYDEANPLYQSSRLLSMHFQQIDNQTILTSYAVEGGQKMILSDSVVFYIKGKILVD